MNSKSTSTGRGILAFLASLVTRLHTDTKLSSIVTRVHAPSGRISRKTIPNARSRSLARVLHSQKLYIWATSVLFAALAGVPDAHTTAEFIGAHVRLGRAFYGCAKLEDLDKIKAMIREKDLDAMIVAAKRGGCEELEKGDRGVVKDHSVWHASTCMRRTGEPDCLWVPDDVVGKDVADREPPEAASPKEGSRDVDTPRCKTAITALVRGGAKVDRPSPSGENMFLLHPAVKDIVLYCGAYNAELLVAFSSKSSKPPASMFALAGAAGAAVSKDAPKAFEQGAARCYKKALASSDGDAKVETTHAAIDCTVLKGEDGGTLISIGPKPPK